MKSLGIVRKIDRLGRLVIPMEIRKVHGWVEGQPMEFLADGDQLIVQAYDGDDDKTEWAELIKQFKQMGLSVDDVKGVFVKRGDTN